MKKNVDVQAYMDELDHPLKAEVELVRAIIKDVHPEIVEEIKWNAPSYSYQGKYLVTFNLHAKQHVHLVFHNPQIPKVHNQILQGDYPDRRMAYFANMQAVEAKKADLQSVLNALIQLQ
jgi:uncharacterized protein YdhG (YjbR/CyaY superfamily)